MASPRSEETRLPAAALQRLQELATARLGLEHRPGKELLLSVRTARHMRELGVNDPGEYLRLLEEDKSGEKIQGLLDLLTTNHTAFWREASHFEWLQTQIAEQWRGPVGRQTIWCAASSSGEEPYTLAMAAREALGPSASEKVRILATDIDTDMVAHGAAGRYAMERAAAIPAELRQRFVRRVDGNTVEMDQALKELIAFKPLNLLGEWPMRGPFDAIFCRNVVIYFDKPTQRVLFDRYAEMLKPDGLLFIGHSESLFRVSDRFQHLGRTVHRRIK